MTRDEWRAELEAAAKDIPLTTTGPDGNLAHMTLGLACCVLERAEIIGIRDAVRELRGYSREQREHTIETKRNNDAATAALKLQTSSDYGKLAE